MRPCQCRSDTSQMGCRQSHPWQAAGVASGRRLGAIRSGALGRALVYVHARVCGAIQPYAHYGRSLAQWQLRLHHIPDATEPDAELKAIIEMRPRAYDPQKAIALSAPPHGTAFCHNRPVMSFHCELRSDAEHDKNPDDEAGVPKESVDHGCDSSVETAYNCSNGHQSRENGAPP